jgi:hypothetical protein
MLLLLYACSTPVIDLPETAEKLIVQSEFSPDEDMEIYVFKGSGIPGVGVDSSVPDSLELQWYSAGKSLNVERVVKDGVIYYRTHDEEYVAGQDYEIRASIPGNEEIASVRSKTTVPAKDSLLNIKISIDSTIESGDWREIGLKLSFDMTTNNWDRYYELKVAQEAEGRLMPPVDTLWTEVSGESLCVRREDFPLPTGVYWLTTRNSFLIDHFKLRDKNLTLHLEMSSNASSDLSRLRFKFRSHTQDGFEFIKSFDRMQSDYYTEFPVLVSNIQNGIGIFTAYAETRQIIDMKTR